MLTLNEILNVENICFIRPVIVNGEKWVEICSADGSKLTVADSRELAIAIVESHDMKAMSVH